MKNYSTADHGDWLADLEERISVLERREAELIARWLKARKAERPRKSDGIN